MRSKLQNLLQLIKTKVQKELLIKITVFILAGVLIVIALFFELKFRKLVKLEGVIHPCQYEGYEVSCNYLETNQGNFLLSEGTIAKVKQVQPTISLYDKKVRLKGRISRQKLAVKNLGKMNRFQIERLEFLE